MRRKLTVPTRTKTYYRLYFYLTSISGAKKVWIGDENTNLNSLKALGEAVGTKYHITKIVETKA